MKALSGAVGRPGTAGEHRPAPPRTAIPGKRFDLALRCRNPTWWRAARCAPGGGGRQHDHPARGRSRRGRWASSVARPLASAPRMGLTAAVGASVAPPGSHRGTSSRRCGPCLTLGDEHDRRIWGAMTTTRVYPTRHDLPSGTREQMVALLNQQLADAFDLYSQTKQAHRNVKGAEFSQLHELFDDLAEAVRGYIDMLAERATALGGEARGT